MAIKIEMLRYFVEVAEAGNLATAAINLGRSPAAVSMMLKTLEQDLGSPLFLTDRKNHLTALGQFTLEVAKRELLRFDGTVSDILNFADSGGGRLRVAAIQAIAANLLPGVFSEMHAENSNIKFDLADVTNSEAISRVRSEDADFALLNDFMIIGKSTLKSELVLSDRIGVLCARDSHLGRKENLYWSDLANEQIVAFNFCKRINEQGVKKALANARMRSASAITIQSIIRTGEYVAPMPELGGISLPTDLVFRVPEGNEYFRNAYLVWSENLVENDNSILFRTILHKKIAELGMLPKVENGDAMPTGYNNGY